MKKNTGNPALKAQIEFESNQEKVPKVSTFDKEKFWKELRCRLVNGLLAAALLIGIGLAISVIIWRLKVMDVAKENSLVASVNMSSLIESMFHVEAPVLLGFVMYATMFILFLMKDSFIALAIKVYDIVFATATAATVASIVIMVGHYFNLQSGKPNWLALWSMTLNYLAVAIFAVKFIFVSTGLQKSPNRGRPNQYLLLIVGYFGGGYSMIYTSMSIQSLTILAIICAMGLIIMITGLYTEGSKGIREDPTLDSFLGAVSMGLIGVLYAGLLYLSCHVSFSTKEILCALESNILSNECTVFKASLFE